MSLLLLYFVAEVTVTEVTIFIIFAVVLLQIVIFSFTDLHGHKFIFEKLAALRFFLMQRVTEVLEIYFIISQKRI